MRFIIQISAWTSSPLAFQSFQVLPLFQESLEPLGAKWSTSFEGETLKFGLHLRDPVSPGFWWFLSSKKIQKEGRWWSRTFLMLLEIQKKRADGGPPNLPAFRDPEKEHHWHRSHEFNSVTGMQATAFYIRVCFFKVGYPWIPWIPWYPSNLRVHHRISGWNGYGDAPFSDTPSGFSTCPTSSALLATNPSLVHGDSYGWFRRLNWRHCTYHIKAYVYGGIQGDLPKNMALYWWSSSIWGSWNSRWIMDYGNENDQYIGYTTSPK